MFITFRLIFRFARDFRSSACEKMYSRVSHTNRVRLDRPEIRLDVSSESSARQRIHMKYQALFSSKDKMSSAAIFVWCFEGYPDNQWN